MELQRNGLGGKIWLYDQPGGASDEKSMFKNQDNRSQIVLAAYQLLAEKGYDSATMKEIAGVAGVAPGLIHYYFESKINCFKKF